MKLLLLSRLTKQLLLLLPMLLADGCIIVRRWRKWINASTGGRWELNGEEKKKSIIASKTVNKGWLEAGGALRTVSCLALLFLYFYM